MGVFDSVNVPCPNCGGGVEFQSKAGECYCNWYTLDTAPAEILRDIVNGPQRCRQCGFWVALIDPDIPPGEPPRPNLRPIMLKTPADAELHSTQPFLQWWPTERPFTYDDIIDPTDIPSKPTTVIFGNVILCLSMRVPR